MSNTAPRRRKKEPATTADVNVRNGGATLHRVLIVDDSLLMRRVIREILEKDPSLQVVGEAADGMQALQRVAELAPDLVLLDIEMPRMDGLEFLRHARLLCDARILVVSSVVQPGSPKIVQAIDLGACDILPKPSGALSVDLEQKRGHELLAAIRDALRP
jgi:two-component system chemotaxis response regulator CheB